MEILLQNPKKGSLGKSMLRELSMKLIGIYLKSRILRELGRILLLLLLASSGARRGWSLVAENFQNSSKDCLGRRMDSIRSSTWMGPNLKISFSIPYLYMKKFSNI